MTTHHQVFLGDAVVGVVDEHFGLECVRGGLAELRGQERASSGQKLEVVLADRNFVEHSVHVVDGENRHLFLAHSLLAKLWMKKKTKILIKWSVFSLWLWSVPFNSASTKPLAWWPEWFATANYCRKKGKLKTWETLSQTRVIYIKQIFAPSGSDLPFPVLLPFRCAEKKVFRGRTPSEVWKATLLACLHNKNR